MATTGSKRPPRRHLPYTVRGVPQVIVLVVCLIVVLFNGQGFAGTKVPSAVNRKLGYVLVTTRGVGLVGVRVAFRASLDEQQNDRLTIDATVAGADRKAADPEVRIVANRPGDHVLDDCGRNGTGPALEVNTQKSFLDQLTDGLKQRLRVSRYGGGARVVRTTANMGEVHLTCRLHEDDFFKRHGPKIYGWAPSIRFSDELPDSPDTAADFTGVATVDLTVPAGRNLTSARPDITHNEFDQHFTWRSTIDRVPLPPSATRTVTSTSPATPAPTATPSAGTSSGGLLPAGGSDTAGDAVIPSLTPPPALLSGPVEKDHGTTAAQPPVAFVVTDPFAVSQEGALFYVGLAVGIAIPVLLSLLNLASDRLWPMPRLPEEPVGRVPAAPATPTGQRRRRSRSGRSDDG